MQIYLIFDLINVNGKYSLWDRDKIGIKYRTYYVTYQKIANFMSKKEIHVSRLESGIFDM